MLTAAEKKIDNVLSLRELSSKFVQVQSRTKIIQPLYKIPFTSRHISFNWTKHEQFWELGKLCCRVVTYKLLAEKLMSNLSFLFLQQGCHELSTSFFYSITSSCQVPFVNYGSKNYLDSDNLMFQTRVYYAVPENVFFCTINEFQGKRYNNNEFIKHRDFPILRPTQYFMRICPPVSQESNYEQFIFQITDYAKTEHNDYIIPFSSSAVRTLYRLTSVPSSIPVSDVPLRLCKLI